VGDSVSGAAGSVSEATPSAQDVKRAARKGKGLAQENPLGLAIGSIAVGFLAGLLVPTTRVEDEKIGPMADTLKEQVRETAQTAVEHGKEAAQEAAQAATQAAKETGQQHAQDAKSDLQDQAQQARSEVASSAPTSS
jgi:gas vesicle protein